MSARTNDSVTVVVAKRLFKIAPDVYKLKKLSIGELEKIIHGVGFYKTKAKHLKGLSERIIKEFNGKIPNTREDLISLPGVGRKTANLVLNRAFNILAISVDTHVHQITNMLGWVHTKTPEQTEKVLNEILPKKYWSDINRFFVSIGRQYTTKKKLEMFLKENKLI